MLPQKIGSYVFSDECARQTGWTIFYLSCLTSTLVGKYEKSENHRTAVRGLGVE